MATRFVTIDRDTPMLLPPDLREWVPADDMVHFVIEAVNGLRLSTVKVNVKGTGSRQYPPKMMLALVIYCYANGIFSSRRIERASYRDIAVRYLTADTHPDHDTICTFRRENFEAVTEAFVGVLALARELGVLKVGTVSVDGTHIRASASKDKNVRYDRAGELEQQLRADVAKLLAEAESSDQQEDNDGQKLPEEIARREKLLAKMTEARAQIERRAKARAEAERAEYERKLRRRQEAGQETGGRRLRKPRHAETPAPQEQVNLTDADSRLMRKSKRSSYEQSYNSQAVVDADGSQLIVGQRVTQCASDANELVPALASVPPEAGVPTAALADSGYANAEVFEQVQSAENGPPQQNGHPGVDLYVAVSRQENHSQRRYEFRPASALQKPAKAIKDPVLLDMRAKLQSESGRRMYAKRKQTVEPVFGIIKSAMGFVRFLLRGLEKVRGEWALVCLAYNLKRLFTLQKA